MHAIFVIYACDMHAMLRDPTAVNPLLSVTYKRRNCAIHVRYACENRVLKIC